MDVTDKKSIIAGQEVIQRSDGKLHILVNKSVTHRSVSKLSLGCSLRVQRRDQWASHALVQRSLRTTAQGYRDAWSRAVRQRVLQ